MPLKNINAFCEGLGNDFENMDQKKCRRVFKSTIFTYCNILF